MKIWLDDIRSAPEGWVHVRTAEEAIDLLGRTPDVEEISLDHDLGEPLDEFGSGQGVVNTLERWQAYGEDKFVPKKISIHSANPVGRKNMQAAIDSIERMRNDQV